jgi:C1A family cysteine protease
MKIIQFLKMMFLFVVTVMPVIARAQIPPLSGNSQMIINMKEISASEKVRNILQGQRAFVSTNNLKFRVGVTAVSELDLKSITGALPADENAASKLKRLFPGRTPTNKPGLNNNISADKILLLRSYDSREKNYIPPVRLQQCGNCWAYSAIGAIEASYIKTNKVPSPFTVDLSEQYIVSCSQAGDCSGGWPYMVFQYLKGPKKSVITEKESPDDGQLHSCPNVPATAGISISDWGPVDLTVDFFNIAAKNKIKESVYKYGAVSTCLLATPLFQNFKSGVFFEIRSNHNNPQINHAVVIIGWNDNKNAWLVRNSWSEDWGEAGYAWVDYDTNNIGYGSFWCQSSFTSSRNTSLTRISQ